MAPVLLAQRLGLPAHLLGCGPGVPAELLRKLGIENAWIKQRHQRAIALREQILQLAATLMLRVHLQRQRLLLLVAQNGHLHRLALVGAQRAIPVRQGSSWSRRRP